MCGIVGYVGKQQAAPILLAGLSKLEYRGYDSAGISVRDAKDGSIAIVLLNKTEEDTAYAIRMQDQVIRVKTPARTISTVVV